MNYITPVKAFCKTENACKLKQLFKFNDAGSSSFELEGDSFKLSEKALKEKLLEARNNLINSDKDAYITLDHMKSNFDNYSYILQSVKGQTQDLNAVSRSDFCNASKIFRKLKLPQDTKVHRAMMGMDFNIGHINAQEFFAKYYKEGKVVTVPIYMESTFDKDVAYRFAKKNPEKFIINLDVPKGTPVVYMEKLAPGDGHAYDNEDELNIIKNAIVRFGKLRQTTNPKTGLPIYELDAKVIGYKNVEPEVVKKHEFDDDDLSILAALKKHFDNN